ncbi:MAG: hypothetical protein QOF37_571 [Thermoleophilaceae bacterium]|nr:hypothetical protein [Thermoleophilaceae bacterium]
MVLVGVLLLLANASAASAGRLIATGHDFDCHAGGANCSTTGQEHFLIVSVAFVRAGAPDPSKPVHDLSCNTSDSSASDLEKVLQTNYGSSLPRTNMCPSSPAFASEPLTTDRYSAILVGSSCHDGHRYSLNNNCEGTSGTTPDSDALNARSADIAAFFNQGGGVLALAGANSGNGDPSDGPDTYYNFVPIGIGGKVVNPPFKLTDAGRLMGIEDSHNGIGTHDDINCCETHNSFVEPPAGSPLQVAERDSTGAPETLVVGNGQIQNGSFVGQSDYPGGSNPLGLPSPKKCVDKRKFRFRIHQPRTGSVRRVDVFINGKRKQSISGNPVNQVAIKRLPVKGKYKVKIIAFTTNLTQTISTRTYRACKKGKVRTHVHK